MADAEPTVEEDETWQEDNQTNKEHEAYETEQTEEGDGLEALQEAVEVMAAELEEAAEAGCDEEELAGLEDQIEGAVEALVTLKEA